MITDFLANAAIAVFVYMTLWFLYAQVRKDNSVADIAWGLGFMLVAYISLYRAAAFTMTQLAVTAIITLWGIRLSTHILLRNAKRGEDPRYAQWRKEWGRWVIVRSYLQVFLLQGFLLLVIAFPVYAANASLTRGLHAIQVIGVLISLFGIIFESIADQQLKAFKADQKNKGTILQTGVWRYSRHPNYFGEALVWWGLAIAVLPTPYGLLAFISPLTITYLLRFVSGVPLAERGMQGNKAFEAYKKRTNAFIPWVPKR